MMAGVKTVAYWPAGAPRPALQSNVTGMKSRKQRLKGHAASV